MIVYMVTNTGNNKVYIGQTVQGLATRKRQHLGNARRGSKLPIHCAIRKYGAENFTWEILCTADSIDELEAREEYFIAAYGTLAYKGKGYNIKLGGGNKRHALSTKKKIGDANRGRKHTPETRKKMGEARKGEKNHNFGKKMSAETRRKLSEGCKGEKHHNFGKKLSIEQRKKISEAQKGKYIGEKHHNFGKKMSVEQRKKISEAMKAEKNHNFGKKFSAAHCKKLSEARKGKYTGEKNPMYGKPVSVETCKKISTALKKRYTKEKIHNFGKKHSPEHCKKISEAMTGEKGTSFDHKIYAFRHEIFGLAFCTQSALREEFGVSPAGISELLRGKRKHTGGWRIASQEYIQTLRETTGERICNQ